MRLPATQPVIDPVGLWSLQLELLAMAESLLGPREASKKIYQPQFTDDGPQLRNTLGPGRRVRGIEPERTAVLAHGSLRDVPRGRFTCSIPFLETRTILRKALPSRFSLHVQSSYGISIPVSMPSYLYALRLVQALLEDPLAAAARVRRQVGSLSAATPQCLAELFPEVDGGVLANLAGGFVRDAG